MPTLPGLGGKLALEYRVGAAAGLAEGAPLSSIPDTSGLGRPAAAQSVAAKRPLARQVTNNGKTFWVADSDGVDDSFALSGTALAVTSGVGQVTVVTVALNTLDDVQTRNLFHTSTPTSSSGRMSAGRASFGGVAVPRVGARRLDSDAFDPAPASNLYPYPVGAYTTFTGVVDYSGATAQLRLGGTQVHTEAVLTAGVTSSTTSAAAALLSDAAGTGEFWAGRTAIIAVYIGALSAAEFAQIESSAQDYTGVTAANYVAPNRPPVVDAGPDAAGTVGTVFTRTATATDPDGETIGDVEWVVMLPKPKWSTAAATFVRTTGAITFTPDVAGSFTFGATATDNSGARSPRDDFQLTASYPLGPYAVDWTGLPDSLDITTPDASFVTPGGAGAWQVLNGKAHHPGASATSTARMDRDTTNSDQRVVVTVAAQTGTGTAEAGVCARWAYNAATYYTLLVKADGAWELRAVVNGVETTLKSGTHPGMQWPYELALECEGDQVRGYIGITQVVSVADTKIPFGSKVGLRSYTGSSSTVDVTNLTATDISGDTTPPAPPVVRLSRRGYTWVEVDIEHDGVDLDHFRAEINSVPVPEAGFLGAAYRLDGLAENTLHDLIIVAVDAAGNEAASGLLLFRTYENTGLVARYGGAWVPVREVVLRPGGNEPVSVAPPTGVVATVVAVAGGTGVNIVRDPQAGSPRFRLTEPGGHDAVHDGDSRTSGALADGPYTYTMYALDEAGNQSTGAVANTVTVGGSTPPTDSSTPPGTDVTPTMDYPTADTYNVATIGKQVITGLWTPPAPGEYTDIVFAGDKDSGQVYFPENFPGKVTLRRVKFLWGEPGLKGPLQNVAVVRNRSAYRHDIIDFEFDGQVRTGDTRTWGGARDGTAFMGKFFLLRGEIHDFSEGIRVAGDSIYRDLHIFGGVPCYDTLRNTMSHVDCFQVSGGENWLIDRCKAIDLNPAGGLEPTMTAALMVGSGDSTNPAQGVVRDSFLDGGQVVIHLGADGSKSTGTRTPRVHFDNVTVGDRCEFTGDQVKDENPTYHTGTIRDWRTGQLVFNNPI